MLGEFSIRDLNLIQGRAGRNVEYIPPRFCYVAFACHCADTPIWLGPSTLSRPRPMIIPCHLKSSTPQPINKVYSLKNRTLGGSYFTRGLACLGGPTEWLTNA